MKRIIPVVDIFAGPGGLSEGFSSFEESGLKFKVVLSIEKDRAAYKTLSLRSFFRQFSKGRVPDEYYDYVRSGEPSREKLLRKFGREARASGEETMLAEIGSSPEVDAFIDEKIHRAVGKTTWILIGGPPCQAYSLAGRSRMRSADPAAFERDHRHFLYRDYLRILAVHRPTIFVLENVKGLLSSKIEGESMFERILADLSNPTEALVGAKPLTRSDSKAKYDIFSLSTPGKREPRDYVLKSELYGIPQRRHRVILVGVQSPFRASLVSPLEPESPTTVEEALGSLPRLRSGLSENDSFKAWLGTLRDAEKYSGQIADSRLSELFRSVARKPTAIDERGGRFVATDLRFGSMSKLAKQFYDPRIRGVLNHETRGHMPSDLHRYLFASCYTQIFGSSPTLGDFPRRLLPAHENVTKAAKASSDFADRFRVQCRHTPASTVVSHIAKDGHYYIHYDPHQCRSLTVREAARLQTFPDNYFFEGNRTEQYAQVGNAVPPMLAERIAGAVSQFLEQCLKQRDLRAPRMEASSKVG